MSSSSSLWGVGWWWWCWCLPLHWETLAGVSGGVRGERDVCYSLVLKIITPFTAGRSPTLTKVGIHIKYNNLTITICHLTQSAQTEVFGSRILGRGRVFLLLLFGNSTHLKTRSGAIAQSLWVEVKEAGGVVVLVVCACACVCSFVLGLSPARWGCCPPAPPRPCRPPRPSPSGCSAGFLRYKTHSSQLFCAHKDVCRDLLVFSCRFFKSIVPLVRWGEWKT